MKDIRGMHAAAVKNAIFKEFSLQPSKTNKRKNAKVGVSNWKKLRQVEDCYNKLYDDSENVVENITKCAFPSIHENDERYCDFYIYTASVCDIVLNPQYPDTEINRKPLERRYSKFKVFTIFL
jgi:hypothetical protein